VQEDLVRHLSRGSAAGDGARSSIAIALDKGRRIVALDVETNAGRTAPATGRFYLRIGAEKREASREGDSAVLDEARTLRYESVPALGSTMADSDEAHLWSYLREFEGGAFEEAQSLGIRRVKCSSAILCWRPVTARTCPTVAGLLLFGRDERVAGVAAARAVTVTRVLRRLAAVAARRTRESDGNLLTIYEALAPLRQPLLRSARDAAEELAGKR
jgi:predicted HTH transcriptional regulator